MSEQIHSAIEDPPAPEARPIAAEIKRAPLWLDGRPRIGIHTSTAGEASRALDTAAR